jgi:hypothetical protein
MPIEPQRPKSGERRTAKRIRDLAAYLLVATIFGLAVVWFAFHSRGLKDDFVARWGGLILNTAILYGYFLKESRPFWHAWVFWLATASVFIVHLLSFIVILQRVEHWSVLWFLFMYAIEVPLLSVLCDWAVHATGGRARYGRDTKDRHD